MLESRGPAMPTASGASRADARTRTAATYAAAALATLGIAATAAADYVVGPKTATAPAKPAEAAKPAPPAASRPRTRLADVGENWPRTLFESLFGIPRR